MNNNNNNVRVDERLSNGQFKKIEDFALSTGIEATENELQKDYEDVANATLEISNKSEGKLGLALRSCGTWMLQNPIQEPHKWNYALIMGAPGAKKELYLRKVG